MGHYTYLLLNVFILAAPLAFSFGKRMHFISNLRYILIAVILVEIVFIPWDMGFAGMNIWRFNPDKILGIFIGNLPLEEYLFFVTLPYMFLFIYEFIRFYIKRDFLRGTHFSFTPVAAIGLSWLLINNFERTYTAIACSFLVLLLLIKLINLRRYMSRFYPALIVCLIPLFILNFILNSMSVIEYSTMAILPVKLGNIPFENFIYDTGIVLLATMGYEWGKRKFPIEAKEISPNP